MGLDVSHDCYSGGYSSFNIWRDRVAIIAGYKMVLHEPTGRMIPDLDWEKITMQQVKGNWKKTPKDPLLVLIVHYDCEGFIRPQQGKALATRLEELLPRLSTERAGGFIPSDRDRAEQFIKGLRQAAREGQNVLFS